MGPDKATDKNPIRLCVFSSLSSILNGGEGRGEEAPVLGIRTHSRGNEPPLPNPLLPRREEGGKLRHTATRLRRFLHPLFHSEWRRGQGKGGPRVGDPKPQPRKRASSPQPSPPAAGKRGGRRDYSQHGFGVSSSLSSYGGEGRGEDAVYRTSELLPPDMMMPEAFQPLAGG